MRSYVELPEASLPPIAVEELDLELAFLFAEVETALIVLDVLHAALIDETADRLQTISRRTRAEPCLREVPHEIGARYPVGPPSPIRSMMASTREKA